MKMAMLLRVRIWECTNDFNGEPLRQKLYTTSDTRKFSFLINLTLQIANTNAREREKKKKRRRPLKATVS